MSSSTNTRASGAALPTAPPGQPSVAAARAGGAAGNTRPKARTAGGIGVANGVIDREAPGIAEAMRRETANKAPMAMLSRGIAGTRNGSLIINLPGSPKGVEECFEVIRPILQHAIDQLAGDTAH